MRQISIARSGVLAATLAVAVILLAGCTPAEETASPSSSSRPSASASVSPDPTTEPSADPSAEPSASASPPPAGSAVDAGCLDLVSLETMYEFDPNFALTDGYSPAEGSRGSVAVAEGGVACGWQQLTSGDTIEITAATPSSSALERLRSEAGVTGAGISFSAAGDVGTVQVFGEDYWVTATSTYFTSATDAAPLTDSAVAAID